MNHLFYPEIFEFLIVVGVLLVEHRDETARTGDIDSPQTRIKLHDVGTCRHRKMRDGFVGVERNDCKCPVSSTEDEAAVVF